MLGHNLDDPMWPFAQIGLTLTPRLMLSSRDLLLTCRYDTEV